MNDHYDIILIGSGMGALTVASLMAQLRDKRALVLEKHDRAGGYTHDFKRGRYHFDTGLHYLGKMREGSITRRMIDLITRGKVEWVPMPDPFDKFIYPDLRFDVYADPKRTIAGLCDLFPDESRAIRRYFKDAKKAGAGLAMEMNRRNGWWVMRGIAALVRSLLRQPIGLTTGAYLDTHFKDPRLKALLASQWGDYGLPPGLSPFGLHGMIVNFYSQGGFYPSGGSGKIAESVRETVESKGGRFLLRREVTGIIIRNGRAVGVRARKAGAGNKGEEEEYLAPEIISNAGTLETYLKLVPLDFPIPFRSDLERFALKHPPTTNLTLFLGFSRDPSQLGLNGANLWIYDGFDHDAIFAEGLAWLESGQPRHACVSFHSLKDPDAQAHSAEILNFTTDYTFFSRWRHQPWNRRDAEYKKLKERISEALIAFVDGFFPGFSDMVEYRELATPLTNEHFTGHHRGAAYGLCSVSERFSSGNIAWTHPKTPLPGLYLTGADAGGLGVTGAMMGGFMCLGYLRDGLRMPNIFRAASRYR
ncbi:MAG: phytoene dehydrogenase [Deltaproteobacteria bacterium SM23_61]|nr:MAG: phytoene dehydrogenase [Deltaproteobacteria bacterium SM23_61]